jgi:formylglycine-generating enzyme required for sulfatase activity/serine/threonine protein kinase/class 3 adenylate cyclase
VNAEAQHTQTSLLVFLFTDIVGSTDLKGRLGDVEGAKVIAAHDVSFRGCVARFGGTEQNNPGDGFFATFPVPSAAMRCALAFQAEIATQSVEARVGIHMGEAVHVPGTGGTQKLLGLAVDTCGRVMSLAMPNQVLITRHAFDSARQQVLLGPNEEPLLWRAHGAYVFKGLNDPIEIHEAGIGGIAPLSPPPDSEKAKRAIAPGEEETLGWRPSVGLDIPGRDGWELQRKLGAGGFGEVWLAISKRTKEPRAFKFCFHVDRLRHLKRELTLFRLLKEALGEREDIARLYDVRLDEAPFFLELEYTPDGSLDAWAVKEDRLKAMSLQDRAELVAGVAEALGAAHSVGVLHKDVKPSNVLVRRDAEGRPHARLTDFGIGQLLDPAILEGVQVTAAGFTETVALTDLGSRTGTRLYMAPELFASKPASIASDVYALGVLLYQMIISDLGRPLAQGWEREISDSLLVKDITACIAGKPSERLPSCETLAKRLRALEARRERLAVKQRRAAADARRVRFLRITSVAAVLLLVLAIGGFVVAGVLEGKREAAETARHRIGRALRERTAALAWKDEALRAMDEALREKDVALTRSRFERNQKSKALKRLERLADSKVARDLVREAADLWPLMPETAPILVAWIRRTKEVVSSRTTHVKALRDATGALALVRKYEDEGVDILKRMAAQGPAESRPSEDDVRALSPARLGWEVQVLTDLLSDMARLVPADGSRGLLHDVQRRHDFVSTLRKRSIEENEAEWRVTIEAIAASPKYGGLKITPQLGLVPLGPNPDSGLYEFAHLGSGSVPTRDRKTKGLVQADDAAIVLVLIPGGTFVMGAQKDDKNKPNHDRRADRDESPVHEVTLSPYFLSKYECTQAQWASVTGGLTPSLYVGRPGSGGWRHTLRSPVEQVSCEECDTWLRRNRLVLPTEGQWEYACRGGTDSPWCTGRDVASLSRVANIADKFLVDATKGQFEGTMEVDDGHAETASVGTFDANRLGFHDMHGNVREWCRDTYGVYRPSAVSDPVVGGGPYRVTRGGAWNGLASEARSAHRFKYVPDETHHYTGLRPARALGED